MSTILVDIDDTTFPLVNQWLVRYNKKFSDTLQYSQITDWNLAQFTSPECGKRIYEIIEDPSIYDGIEPFAGVKESISTIRQLDNNIIWCTHSTLGCAGRKFLLLREHGLWDDKDDYFEVKSSESKLKIKADICIDDKFETVKEFSNLGGLGFLVLRPWNKKHLPYSPAFEDWFDFLELIKRIA